MVNYAYAGCRMKKKNHLTVGMLFAGHECSRDWGWGVFKKNGIMLRKKFNVSAGVMKNLM